MAADKKIINFRADRTLAEQAAAGAARLETSLTDALTGTLRQLAAGTWTPPEVERSAFGAPLPVKSPEQARAGTSIEALEAIRQAADASVDVREHTAAQADRNLAAAGTQTDDLHEWLAAQEVEQADFYGAITGVPSAPPRTIPASGQAAAGEVPDLCWDDPA